MDSGPCTKKLSGRPEKVPTSMGHGAVGGFGDIQTAEPRKKLLTLYKTLMVYSTDPGAAPGPSPFQRFGLRGAWIMGVGPREAAAKAGRLAAVESSTGTWNGRSLCTTAFPLEKADGSAWSCRSN